MPTRNKKSLINALPLLNISLPKLAFAVIMASLLTISLFVIENRKQIETSAIVSAVMAKPISVTVKLIPLAGTPIEKSVPSFENETVATMLSNNFSTQSVDQNWKYTVNGIVPNLPMDRVALKSGDEVICSAK